MTTYELYSLDNPAEVLLEAEANSPEEALEMMAAVVGSTDECLISVHLLTMVAGDRLLGVRGAGRVPARVKEVGDEW